MFREKGYWERVWEQERSKAFGSAIAGVLRRNHHSRPHLDYDGL